MARCCSVALAGIPGVAKMFFSLSFIVYWSLQMYVKISGNMCILPRMIVENTLYRAFRLIIAPNRPRSVWQNGCSYHIFLLAPVCNMALAAGARQWLPCPLCHARSRFLAVCGRAGVPSGRPPLCCHFCQIVSSSRPAAQPLGCQRVAVWAVLNGKTARFAAPNGRFCGLVRAVSPVRNGMAWAASRRCNYFVSCFRKAAGWLAVILCNASQALGPRLPRLVGLRHRPRQRPVGTATMIRLCGPRRHAGACGRGDCAPRPA